MLDSVQKFMDRSDKRDIDKKIRLKKELHFVRESSTTLPSCDPIFKIQVTKQETESQDGRGVFCFIDGLPRQEG